MKSLSYVKVSRSALISNFTYFKKNNYLKIFPNLKSYAYGHGVNTIAPVINQLNCEYVIAHSLEEAIEIKESGIKSSVLITGFVIPENLAQAPFDFTFAVWESNQIKEILKYKPNSKFQIFIDSGMSREGLTLKDLEKEINELLPFKDYVEGILSHFASANEDTNQNLTQIDNFTNAINLLESYGFKLEYKHISATAGLLTQDNSNYNAARLGKGFYGINPINQDGNLKPALSYITTLVQVKDINKGDLVGYGATFKAEDNLKVGILPIGYNEGVDRRLSNTGFVKINNVYCKIIGRVSMNTTTIDITNLPNPSVGQEVEVYSNNPFDKNSIETTAQICNTIPYDILVAIPKQIPRVLVD